MADIKGLLADPDFNKLDPATQRTTLGRIDPDFANLSDQDYAAFRQRMTPPAPMAGSQLSDWNNNSLLSTAGHLVADPFINLAKMASGVLHGNLPSLKPPARQDLEQMAAAGKDPSYMPQWSGASPLGIEEPLSQDVLPSLESFGGLAAGSNIPNLPLGRTLSFVANPRKAITLAIRDALESTLNPEEPKTPGPFRPNPAIAKKTPFGGPAPTDYSPPAATINRNWSVPDLPLTPEGQIEPPTAGGKFQVNPNIKKLLKSPSSSSGSPGMPARTGGRLIPRKGWAGPPESDVDVQPTPERTTTPENYVEPVKTWNNSNRQLHAVVQQLDLPESPSGSKAPGRISQAAKEVFGAKNGATDLTPDQLDSLSEFLVKNKRWPKKGEL